MKIENKKLISVEESDLVDGVFSNTEITEIGDYCFYMMGKLIKVYCPNVTKMGDWNFYNNHALTTIGDFPLLAEQGDWNFSANPALTTIGDFPLLAKQWSCNFYYNPALTTIGDFPLLAKQGNYNFSHNPALTKLSIGGESLNVKSVDGSCFVIESTTTKLGINIYTGYNLLSITNGIIKKEHCFVAEKDGFFAHGETVKKAIQDLQFKAIAEKLKNEPIKADTVISVQYYRTVTGACEMGCKSWMNQNGISVEEMTAAELLPLLKKTSAYGYEKIKAMTNELRQDFINLRNIENHVSGEDESDTPPPDIDNNEILATCDLCKIIAPKSDMQLVGGEYICEECRIEISDEI